MSTKSISPGTVNALVNRALTSVIRPPDDLELSTGNGLSETHNDALCQVLFQLCRKDEEVRTRVHEERGFAIGVEVTRLVMEAPLGDHRAAIKKFVNDCIDEVKEHVAEDRRSGAAT